VGDTIDLGNDAVGVVEELNLRTTRLRGGDGTVWFVPNGEVRRVGNASMEFSRAVVDVPIGKDGDVARSLKSIHAEVDTFAREWVEHLVEPPTVLGVQNLSAVDGPLVRITAVTAPGEQYKVARELRSRVAARLYRDARPARRRSTT
jgi:small conductance mechanosensitive channel